MLPASGASGAPQGEGTLAGNEIIARYLVTKLSWKGRYRRILCITPTSVVTQDPATLYLTNTWSFTGPDPDLAGVSLGGGEGEELEVVLHARPDKRSRHKSVKFACASRGALLSDLYQAFGRTAPSLLPSAPMEFPAFKLKWRPGMGQGAQHGRMEWRRVRLRVTCWGMDCVDPVTGIVTWRVAYSGFGTPGIQALARSGDAGEPDGLFAVHLRSGRCPRVLASERRAEILTQVQSLVRSHLGIVFALAPRESGTPADLLDQWTARERDRALQPGEAPLGEWTVRRLRERVLYPENAAAVEKMLSGEADGAHAAHASLKRIHVTPTCLVEKKLDTHETTARYPLTAVSRIVRFADEPLRLAVEWAEPAAHPAVYVTSERDAVVCALLDAAQLHCGRAIPIVPHLTERSDAVVSLSAGLHQDSEVEKLCLATLASACRDAVEARALVPLPPSLSEPVQEEAKPGNHEGDNGAAGAGADGGAEADGTGEDGEAAAHRDAADGPRGEGREESHTEASTSSSSSTRAGTSPTPEKRRAALRLPKGVEQAVARTVRRTVKGASTYLKSTGLPEALREAAQQAAAARDKVRAARAEKERSNARHGLQVPSGSQASSDSFSPAPAPWASPSLTRLVERLLEFNASVWYGGVRTTAKVDDVIVPALMALLPAAPAPGAGPLDLDPDAARVCHVVLGALVRLVSSWAAAAQLAQGAANYGPKLTAMVAARDAGVASEAARLLTRLWAPGPSRAGAVVWAHPTGKPEAGDKPLPSTPTPSHGGAATPALGLTSAEDAASARSVKAALLGPGNSRWPFGVPEEQRLSRVLFSALRGTPTRSVLARTRDPREAEAGGSSQLLPPSALAAMSVIEAVASAMCIPGALSTDPNALAELVRGCAGLGRSLFSLFAHPARRVSDSVAVVMTTVVAQGGPDVAAPMRDAALREGALLLHLHQALFGVGARRSLSQGLVALWADDYLPALSVLKRAVPMGLVRYLTPPPNQRPRKDPQEAAAAAAAATAAAVAAAAAASNPNPQQGPVVVRNPLNPRAVKVVDPSEAAATAAAAGAGTGSATPAAPEPPAVSVSSVLRLNWDLFFEQALRDHSDAALIWNERTRQELRAALEDEINVLRVGRARSSSGPGPTWNYRDFRVSYASLTRELSVGFVYVRHLMGTDAAPPAARAAEDDEDAAPMPPRPAIDKLADPRGFFQALYHHLLTSPFGALSTALGATTAEHSASSGDDADRALCVQAMTAVYRAHAGTVGPFEGVDFLMRLADRTPSHQLRIALLELLRALVEPGPTATHRFPERTPSAVAANLASLMDCPGALEALVEGATLCHLGPAPGDGWATGTEGDPSQSQSQPRQWFLFRPASSAEERAAAVVQEASARAAEDDRPEDAAEGGAAKGPDVVVIHGSPYVREGPLSIAELGRLLAEGKATMGSYVAPRTGQLAAADPRVPDPQPIRNIRLLRWLFPKGATLESRAPAALGEACWALVRAAALAASGSDEDGAALLPLPRALRLLAQPTLLPHVAQLSLTGHPHHISQVAEVLLRVLTHNSAGLGKLYSSGWFYFTLAYDRGGLEEASALLKLAHARQRFMGEGDTLIDNPAIPLSRRSFLGHLLPEGLLHTLEGHPAPVFARAFVSDSDTPELIWTHEMRSRVLVPALRAHVGPFRAILSGNPLAVWDFSLTAPLDYPQLQGEVWCHRYHLRSLCDEIRFPDWEVTEPVPLLQALLAAWRREELRRPPDMTIAEALELLGATAADLPGAAAAAGSDTASPEGPEGGLRRAYRRVCRLYHPDKNPSPEARDRFLRIQKAFERLKNATASDLKPDADASAEAGPRAAVVDLLLRAQCIVYRRCRQELGPFRYAGYPLVLGVVARSLGSSEGRGDAVAADLGRRLVLCLELAWLTCCASPRNALELMRNQGLESIMAVLRKALDSEAAQQGGTSQSSAVSRATSGAAAAAAGGSSVGPMAPGSPLAAYCLRTLAGICAFPEALGEAGRHADLPRLVLRGLMSDPVRQPAVVEGALCCAINMCQAPLTQLALVRGGAITIALPLCLRFDPAVTAAELRGLMEGPATAALPPGAGPLELLLGVNSEAGGLWGGAEEEADGAGRTHLDRSLAPFFLGALGLTRSRVPPALCLHSCLAARLLAQLGGYLGGILATPQQPLARSALRALLTPAVEEMLCTIDPRMFLCDLAGAREEAHVIWTPAMRAEMAAHLEAARGLVEEGLREGGGPGLGEDEAPAALTASLAFRHSSLESELRVAGVYVRVFRDRPTLPVRDAAEFGLGLCRLASKNAVQRGQGAGLEPVTLAAYLCLDTSERDPLDSTLGTPQGHEWLLQALGALRSLVLQVPKAALFVATPQPAWPIRSLLALLEPPVRWGHVRHAAQQAAQTPGAAPLAPIDPADLAVCRATLEALVALSSTAACVEVMAAERTALTCMWLVHTPPDPETAALATSLLTSLSAHPTTASAALLQAGLYFLLNFAFPLEALSGAAAAAPVDGGDPLRPQRETVAALVPRLLASPAHGGKLRALMAKLLPSGLLAAFEDPSDSHPLTALATATENPERIWTRAMQEAFAGEMSVIASNARASQFRTLAASSASLSPNAPALFWSPPGGEAYRVRYPALDGEPFLGGVYLRLFLEDPRYPLRNPRRFLEALLDRLTQEASGPGGQGAARGCVVLAAAIVALLRADAQLGDHLVSLGYVTRLLTLLTGRMAGSGMTDLGGEGAAGAAAGHTAATAPIRTQVDPLLGHSSTALVLKGPGADAGRFAAPLDPLAALQAARLSESSGVPADEAGGALLRVLHQVSERAAACEALAVATPPLVPAVKGALRWGSAAALLALETFKRVVSAVNTARDAAVAQALRFGLVATLLATLERKGAQANTAASAGSAGESDTSAGREEAAAEKVLAVEVLQLLSQEGTYAEQVLALLQASPAWATLGDQRHDMYLPAGSSAAGAGGVVGLLTGGVAEFALPAPSDILRLTDGQQGGGPL